MQQTIRMMDALGITRDLRADHARRIKIVFRAAHAPDAAAVEHFHFERARRRAVIAIAWAASTRIAAVSADAAIAITLSRLITMSAMVTIQTARQRLSAASTLPSSSPPESSTTSFTATHNSNRPPTSLRYG